MLLLKKGDYIFSFDLKSGYHHVEIAEVHYKYLGFAWNDKFYVFKVLPFGLACTCYILPSSYGLLFDTGGENV